MLSEFNFLKDQFIKKFGNVFRGTDQIKPTARGKYTVAYRFVNCIMISRNCTYNPRAEVFTIRKGELIKSENVIGVKVTERKENQSTQWVNWGNLSLFKI